MRRLRILAAEDEAAPRSLVAAVLAVLTRPFDLTELLDLVSAVLAHKR